MLTDQNITIHPTVLSWRFEININKFELFESKEFVIDLKKITVYALIIIDIETTKKQSKSSEISKDY